MHDTNCLQSKLYKSRALKALVVKPDDWQQRDPCCFLVLNEVKFKWVHMRLKSILSNYENNSGMICVVYGVHI